MDINYILKCEQISLHNSLTASSGSTRTAHAASAKAYGKLLSESSFPHRESIKLYFKHPLSEGVGRWENEGGSCL